jgi:hypothetical protein
MVQQMPNAMAAPGYFPATTAGILQGTDIIFVGFATRISRGRSMYF